MGEHKVALLSEQSDYEKLLKDRLAKTEGDLSAQIYTIKGKSVRVVNGAFDRDKKTWPLILTSTDSRLPYNKAFELSISSSTDMKEAFASYDAKLKAGSLAGEIDYCVKRMPQSKLFLIIVRNSRIIDLLSGNIVANSDTWEGLYCISEADSSKHIPYATPIKLANAQQRLSTLQTKYNKSVSRQASINTLSSISGQAFLYGGLAAALLYSLGAEGMSKYRSDTTIATISADRSAVELYNAAFITSAAIAAAGGLTWIFTAATKSQPDKLNSQVQACLATVQALEAQKKAEGVEQ